MVRRYRSHQCHPVSPRGQDSCSPNLQHRMICLLQRWRDILVQHSLLRGADESCLLALLILNLLPHPEAVNQCASGWPASEAR